MAKISNNLDHNKDRGYEYDALGRLRRATGGQNVNWVERYDYDRYGNRSNIFSYTADQYVRNFYQSALNRQPNSTELQTKVSALQSGYAQGPTQFLATMQSLGNELFSSTEYANRNRSEADAKHQVMKKPCQDFLRAHGINPKSVLNAIERQRPFDGLGSTLTLRAAGVVGRANRYAAWTVQQYFQIFEPGAMTANARRATRFNVYFGSYYGPNPTMTIIHEALHSVTMLGDWDLAVKLGIINDYNVMDFIRAGKSASAEIDGYLATHGCFQL